MEERTTPWSGHDPVEDRRTTVWTQMKVQGAAVEGAGWAYSPLCWERPCSSAVGDVVGVAAGQGDQVQPDQAQVPVRLRALQEDKMLYMAVPRLTEERCFVELTAAELRHRPGVALEVAAASRGAMQHGRLVAVGEMSPLILWS